MTLPSPPLNLAADATNSTTVNLTWSAPTNDGGFSIVGYRIDRSLAGVLNGFSNLIGGSGYVTPPTVTFTGGNGIGAAATAILTNEVVTSFTITAIGNGYTTAPTVEISEPVSGTPATVNSTISNAAFTIFLANSGNTNTFLPDTTLFPRNNPIYKVAAINSDTPLTAGPFSDEASSTTSTSEAQTIAQLLFTDWSLTGELAKVASSTMTEPVHFFDRGQVPGNKFAKAVTVQKVNALGNEHIIEHPKFFEQSDTFEITCFLQVIDSADDQFSVWVDLMQQMTGEVTEILRTKFAPSGGTGVFFTTNLDWTRDDTFFTDDPQLTRTLQFTLTRIFSNESTVFVGYPQGKTAVDGVLVFDISDSTGDSKPGTDYVYLQVTQIQLDEGWTQIPILTKDTTKGVGVPQIVRGIFSGVFSALMFAKKDDIIGNTLDKLEKIYIPQLVITSTTVFHQTAEVALLQSVSSTETTASVLTVKSIMRIDRITKIFEDDDLVKFRVRGNLTKPSGFSST